MSGHRHYQLSELYLDLLDLVWNSPAYFTAPRGQTTRERVFVGAELDLCNPGELVTHSEERNAKLRNYYSRELELYESGTLRSEDFGRLAKLWERIANPDGTINSNYGYLALFAHECGTPDLERAAGGTGEMRTHWEWCVESLCSDPDSRQAVIHFSRPRHLWKGNKDQVCALSAQFMLRRDEVLLGWTIRSNDIVFGLPYDIQFAMWLARKMAAELAQRLKRPIAAGRLSYFANSLHAYERDAALITAMLGKQAAH